jgi:hypothetical protein
MLNRLFGRNPNEKHTTAQKHEKSLDLKNLNRLKKQLSLKEKHAYLVHSSLLDSLQKMKEVGEYDNELNEIIDTLIRHSFDPGCNRDLDWREKGSPKGETTSAVEIYNRSTLCNFIISQVTDEQGNYNGTPCSIAFWDGSGIKDADSAKGVDEKPYADLAINKMAKVAVETFGKATTLFGGENFASRWGGDEFWGCSIGGNQQSIKQFIKQALPKNLAHEKGVFLETTTFTDRKGIEQTEKKLVRKPLGLKQTPTEPAIHFIEIPTDPERNILFLHFLKKGLILKSTDIDNIQSEIAYFSGVSTKEFLEVVYSNDFYPNSIKSNEEKIEFIKTLSPHHGNLLQLALKNNLELSTKNGNLNMFDTLLDYVEKTIFHQLLGRNVGTFTEMYETLVKSQPEWITTEDIRFVKELNENSKFSYVGADLTLKDGSDEINTITNANKGFVTHYQRGGTAFQTYSEDLHDKTIQSLTNLQSIEVNRKSEIYDKLKQAGVIASQHQLELEEKISKEESTKIPIGFAQVKINYPLNRKNTHEVETAIKNSLNQMFEFSKVSWHMNFFRLIVEQVINNKQQHSQFYELLEAYLTQKRSDERMEDIEENIPRISEYAPDINEYALLIQHTLREIVENYKNKQPVNEIKPKSLEPLDQYMSKRHSTYPVRKV